MDVKSLINYQAMEKSMITYFHTGDAEEVEEELDL